jgi:hypothetical protein
VCGIYAGFPLIIPLLAIGALTMRVEVYEALAERVGGALDYDVRW